MASRSNAPYTSAQGRKFGLTVGLAFLVFAGVAWWRAHPMASQILGAAGALLIVSGVLLPTYLGPVERQWMALAHLISKVTTPLVMGVMYLFVLTPTGFLRRMLGGNPMIHPAKDTSYWKLRAEGRRASDLKRQY